MDNSRDTTNCESKRFTISKLSFLTVMEALEHEQRANTPMLMAMAFLTAAASAIFAAAYYRLWSPDNLAVQTLLSHPMLVSFSIFIVLILVGTSFSVSAQRSQLHLEKTNSDEAAEKSVPKSLFFWKQIAEIPKKDNFISYMTDTDEADLVTKACKDLAQEAYLMSLLVKGKHQNRGKASLFFLLALINFGVFLGFALNLVFGCGIIWGMIFGSVIAAVVAFLYIDNLRDRCNRLKTNLRHRLRK